MDFAIGAVTGLLFLAIYWRMKPATIAQVSVLTFGIMLGIYVGAHLVTSELPRVLIEIAGGSVALLLAMVFQRKWRMGIGLLILGHGGYDVLMGHSTGVADWYPGLCVGFDVIVGLGLTWRLRGSMA